MSVVRKIFFWLILAIPFICNAQPSKDPNVFTEDKSSFSITQDKPEFIIKLKSNPTTGYSWFLREYQNDLIEPVSQRFEAPADKKLMGAPGYDIW